MGRCWVAMLACFGVGGFIGMICVEFLPQPYALLATIPLSGTAGWLMDKYLLPQD